MSELLKGPVFQITIAGRPMRQSNILDQTVRWVCRTECNNGWMARLETKVQPILTPLILGKRTLVSPRDQATLSFWLMKTISMMELAFPDGLVPPEHYEYMYRHRRPWPSAFIWMAPYHAVRNASVFQRLPYRIYVDGRGIPDHTNGVAYTINLFRVVFQALVVWERKRTTLHDVRRSRVVPTGIFPLTGQPVLWPTRIAFAEDYLYTFADSIDQLEIVILDEDA